MADSVMRRTPRKRPTLDERRISCRYCNYPISQRHHMLPVSVYGETANILNLCANCHEAFHIFAHAYEDILAGREGTRNITLMLKLRWHWQSNNAYQTERLCGHVRMTYDQQHGTITDRVWDDFFGAYDRRIEEQRWRV